jgi:hypothetical protein
MNEPGLIARWIRRALRGDSALPTSVLSSAATLLEKQIDLAQLEKAFAAQYQWRRSTSAGLALRHPPNDYYFPPEHTLRIVPAFVKMWLREQGLTARFTMTLCHNFVDFLLADSEPLQPNERIASPERIQADKAKADIFKLTRTLKG